MPTTYRFGPYVFDWFVVKRDGVPVRLEEQQVEVLRILIEWAESHPTAYVPKEELKKRLWHDAAMGDVDQSLREVVSKLRRNLGSRPDRTPYITRNQYRLSVGVERVEDAEADGTSASAVEAALDAGDGARAARVRAPGGADPLNSPYVGPQPIPQERAADFFGRGEEVAELARLLSDRHTSVVALYSPSGAGKTSLLNTALRGKLVEGGHHVLPIARVGVPPGPVRPAPGQNQYTLAAIAGIEQESESLLGGRALTWADYLALKGSTPRTVLVIDQLEEVVTIDKPGPLRQKQEFFVELREAVARDESLRVLLAFREEYLAQLQRLAGELAQMWKPYPLPLLGREDCALAISGPAARHGVKFDETVLRQLVDKLTTVRYEDEWGVLCDEPGEFAEPLQLQLICDTLWRSLPAHRQVISWGDLRHASRREGGPDAAPGTEQTISRFVESVLYRFCEEATQAASEVARLDGEAAGFPEELTILGCLQFVSERGVRTQIRRGEEWTGELPNAVVDALAARQFLRVEQRHADRWYELAHDTLIRPVVDRADRIDDDALRAVFSGVVREVAADERARREAVTEAAIAQETCLVFVARDGSRLQASLASLESEAARLPPWVVEALAGRGILRRVRLHEQTGYELTHWRMALALHRERFLALDRLYNARKLLATHLDLCLAPDASPAVWYQNSDNILKNVEEFVGVANLSDMEARFALCASLATGYHLDDFAVQVGNKFSGVAADALREAAGYTPDYTPDPNVRRHAARALGLLPSERREETLLELALKDPDESVQGAAARALAGLENVGYLERLFGLLDEPASRPRALKALAWIHDAGPADGGRQFEERRRRLPLSRRLGFRAVLTGVRLKRAWKRLLVALLVGLLSTALLTAPPRGLLAAFGLTITQNEPMGLFEGLFHGLAGALLWSLFIGGSLLCWWFVGERRRPWRGEYSTLVGALGGLVGGVLNTLALISVFGPKTLANMRWIETPQSSPLETLTASGLALAMPLYGALVGLGVGEAARRLLPRWRKTAPRPDGEAEQTGIRQALRSTANETLLHSGLILLLLLGAAVVCRAFLGMMPLQPPYYGQKLFGEAFSLYFGGLGLLLGLFVGLHILRKGLHIPGDEELS